MSVCANVPSGRSVKTPWQDRARNSLRSGFGSALTAAARSSTGSGVSPRASATPSRAAARRAAATAAPKTSSLNRMGGGGAAGLPWAEVWTSWVRAVRAVGEGSPAGLV